MTSTSINIPLEWSWEPAQRLGGRDEGAQSFYMLHEWLVDTDGLGRIYVLDPTRAMVLVFDSAGTHLRSLGGRGNGPGEFVEPVALAVSEDGTVAVADFDRRSVVRWDSGGHLLAPIDSVRVLPLTHKPLGFLEDQLLKVQETRGGFGDSVDWRLVDAERAGAEPLGVISRPRARPMNIGCAFGLFAPLFTPDMVWEAYGSTVGVANGGAYDLMIARGEDRMRLRRDLPTREVSQAMALQEVSSGLVAVGPQTMACGAPPDVRLERQGYAPELPTIADVELAPDGSIWVERTAIHGEPRLIDVFDADGVYEGTLPAGSPFPVAFLPDGAPLTIERDELDISRLIVQRKASD